MRRTLMILCTLAISLSMGALIAEIGLRLAGFEAFQSIQYYDHYTGGRLYPGYSGTFTNEGYSEFTVNARGFRDEEHTFQKPPGVYRIVLLGDSYIEALQVPLEDSFGKFLETSFNRVACDSVRFEVINLSVSGYGTAQEYIMLSREGFRYEPDLVLLSVTLQNDIRNNSKALEPEWQNMPFFTLSGDSLTVDNEFRTFNPPWKQYAKRIWYTIQPHSVFLSQLVYRSKILIAEIRSDQSPPAPTPSSDETAALSEKNDFNIYATEPSKTWQDAWDVTLALIREISDLCAAREVPFAMISVPSAIATYQDRWDETLEKYPVMQSQKWDRNNPERNLSALANQYNIKYLDPAPAFRARYHDYQEVLHFNRIGHWTREGHRMASAETFRFLTGHYQMPVCR